MYPYIPVNENDPFNSSHPLPHYTKEPMASSNLHHQHSWEGEMMNLCLSHFGYFIQSIFLWHPFEGSCQSHSASITVSGYAQLRCNNPNSHSLQFPHFRLHTHSPYVHIHLCRRFSSYLEDQTHRSTSCRLNEGGIYSLLT